MEIWGRGGGPGPGNQRMDTTLLAQTLVNVANNLLDSQQQTTVSFARILSGREAGGDAAFDDVGAGSRRRRSGF